MKPMAPNSPALLRLVAFAAAVLLIFVIAVPIVLGASGSLPHTGRVLVSTGGDITLPAGEQADVVVVVNGTATIEGVVNTLVVVDGSAVLNGAATETVFAVRSPVTIGTGTVVRGDVMTFDSNVHFIGTGTIQGTTRDLALDMAGIGLVLGPALLLLFVGFALAAIAAGLFLAALAARQVRAAESLISHEPVQTLLVGLAGILLPILLLAVLFVTVVGAPLALGILFGLWPLAAFLGYLVAGIWIGDWILSRTSPTVVRERPYLAAVIGLFLLEVAAIWPFLPMIASLFGYGAVLLLAWRTFRPRKEATPAVARHEAMPAAG